LPEHQVRIHKAGSWKMKKSPLICALFAPVLRQPQDDTGKSKLDVAIDSQAGGLQVDNDPNGHAVLVAWRACGPADWHRGERRLPASVAKPRAEGFQVVVLQPKQVRVPCFACKGPRTISLMPLSSPLAPLRSKPAKLPGFALRGARRAPPSYRANRGG
jgi:hypothetical protein